jgi:putative restriction endonuclease
MENIRGRTTFKTEIGRISNSGNGIVHKGGNLRNIGPVTEDSIGETIVATELSSLFALCHTNSVTVDDYEEKFIDWITNSEKWEEKVPSPEEIRKISETGPDTDSPFPAGNEVNNQDTNTQKAGSSKEQEAESVDKASGRPSSLTEQRDEVETTRVRRDQEFRRQVKEVYDNRCAICGAQRMTPDGRPEVESAHIYPVEEGGPDTVQNGIALCRLHHWGFDNSWISITDEYEVLVRDKPSQETYDDFAEYEGIEIYYPDRDSLQPHPKFLQKHRERHGFD